MKFETLVNSEYFSITMEVSPPKGSGYKKLIQKLEPLIPYVDTINVVSCPLGQLKMEPLAFAVILRDHFNIDVVLHLTMRDLSWLGLQSWLLGASALGFHNILAMTGDAPKHSNIPQTKGVYQSNSMDLTRLIHKMNDGFHLANGKLNKKTSFFVGGTANPTAMNLANEIKKMEKKIEAGTQFFQTQPLFINQNLDIFLRYSKNIQTPILISSMLLKDYETSLWMNQNIPGLFIPSEVMTRMKEKDSQEEAQKIFMEFWHQAKYKTKGIHLFPMNNFEAILEILQEMYNSLPQNRRPPKEIQDS